MAVEQQWDPVLRTLHWTLAALTAGALWLGHFGPVVMSWHFNLGYAIGVWLGARLLWGLVGPRTARLRALIHPVSDIAAYARRLPERRPSRWRGHNPLGSLAVIALFVLLLAQVATGLFADDEVFSAGPLAETVGEALRRRLTAWHATGAWAILGVVSLHLAAILFYAVWKREDLVGPMILGRSRHGGER